MFRRAKSIDIKERLGVMHGTFRPHISDIPAKVRLYCINGRGPDLDIDMDL